jgi:hypothetical protein
MASVPWELQGVPSKRTRNLEALDVSGIAPRTHMGSMASMIGIVTSLTGFSWSSMSTLDELKDTKRWSAGVVNSRCPRIG